jgi:predicted Fe-S protein YdhL (DUF1289 family)
MRMNCASDGSHCKSKCLKIALMVVVGIAALGWVVMLLWNWLMPALFAGAQEVGYWQALGILLLSKILFGGFRGGCHERRNELHQRWEAMSPEEREQLKGQLKSRWGNWCNHGKRDDQTANDEPPRAE